MIECMFGYVVIKIDFDYINYMKLILDKTELNVKLFLFRYFK